LSLRSGGSKTRPTSTQNHDPNYLTKSYPTGTDEQLAEKWNWVKKTLNQRSGPLWLARSKPEADHHSQESVARTTSRAVVAISIQQWKRPTHEAQRDFSDLATWTNKDSTKNTSDLAQIKEEPDSIKQNTKTDFSLQSKQDSHGPWMSLLSLPHLIIEKKLVHASLSLF
jgi:hypothetical protein